MQQGHVSIALARRFLDALVWRWCLFVGGQTQVEEAKGVEGGVHTGEGGRRVDGCELAEGEGQKVRPGGGRV